MDGPQKGQALTALALALLTGCAVGPDFQPPTAPEVSRYTPAPMVAATVAAPGAEGAAQQFHDGEAVPAEWWSRFACPELDALMRVAIQNSPDLKSAAAALRAAREQITVARSALFPSLSGAVQDARERISPITEGLPPGLYELNVVDVALNASYTVDAFGATRRAIEGSQAQAEYAVFELEAAYLTLTSSIVASAVREASLRAQIAATHDVLAAENHELELLQKQFQYGAVGRANLLTQQSVVASTEATLPGLEKQLAQSRHLLAILAGRMPSATDLPEFTLENLHLPTELPVSLPSQLVRQRPDLRASEALLHAASAQVGVATAARYPQIVLSASYGREGLDYSQLFKPGATIWTLGAGLTQPIFNAGELSARQRAAKANYDQAEAQYQSLVLSAFQSVADALRALDTDAAALAAYAESAAVAKQSLDLSQRQYKLGAVSFFQLLQNETLYQQARISLAQAQAARLADSATLFSALGGGWWNRSQPLAQANSQALVP